MNFYRGLETSGKEDDSPKVLRMDRETFAELTESISAQAEEVYRDNLEDKGIYSEKQLDVMARKYREETAMEMIRDYSGETAAAVDTTTEEIPQIREDADKYLFGWGRKEVAETNENVAARLEQCGVQCIELKGVLEKYQETLARDVEEMCEAYPELKGYIGSVRSVDMENNVFASAGPRMDENGFHAEIRINKRIYSQEGVEERIAQHQRPNWKGETYFAGQGEDVVFKHEMAHVLHLRMLAEEKGLEPGSRDVQTYREVQEAYKNNLIVSRLCSDAYCQLGILNQGDRAKVLSIYGASDLGECFAEAISEYETRDNPRPFATTVYENYQRRIQENDDSTAK